MSIKSSVSTFRSSLAAKPDTNNSYLLQDYLNVPEFIGGMPSAISSPSPIKSNARPNQATYVAGFAQGQANPANGQPLQQSGNATQRWQSGQIHNMRVDNGVIDASAPQSPMDTTPSGAAGNAGVAGQFTPPDQWDAGFNRQIKIPQANAPAAGFSWQSWYPTAGGNPNAPALPVNKVQDQTVKPDYNS